MNRKIKSIVCITLASILLAFGGSAAIAAPEMVLKFAGQHAADHPATTLMNDIAKEIAEKSGISEKLILEWVNLADLFRIKGVGEEYSDLLEEAGVDTVVELAQRNPDNLYEKVVDVNHQKKLVRKLPTQGQVDDWVRQAKNLPRVVTY